MFDALQADTRAIEGLPIRLVIALVVGVASLSVMMSTVGGLEAMTVSEVDVSPDPAVIDEAYTHLDLTVVDPDGSPVAGATVVVTSGTATIDDVETAETDEQGVADVAISPSLGPNQAEGTVEVSVKPPAGSGYTDRRSNSAILVVAD